MKHLILIGGSAGAGKTTTARVVAQRLDADWLQIDALWVAIREALPEEHPHRTLLRFDEVIRAGELTLDQLVERHVAAGEVICAAAKGSLDFMVYCHDRVVADGAWLLPEFMATLELPDTEIRPVVIHESDALEVKLAMRSRSTLASTTPFQARGATLSWMYGNWLAAEAERLGIPVVAARPRETLVERVLEATRSA